MTGRRKGVRILVDDQVAGDLADAFGVCVGLRRPHRGAWWRLVSTHERQAAADQAFERLDRWTGRALIKLQHESILAIDVAGVPLAVSS